jgi:excisionase family DNA binding protein
MTSRRIEPDAIYTVNEAATLISIHPETVTKKLRQGAIAGKRRLGRWRIRGAELLKLG